MAIEQKVVIRVEIDPDMSKAAAVNAFLTTLDKRLGKTNKSMSKTVDLLKSGMAYHLAENAKRMAAFGKSILKVNFKGLVVELALVTAGLVVMKGALSAGRGIMKGWANTVSFLKTTTAGFTAGLVVLVSTLMAANRQFQQTQLSPFIGGMQNAREAMGALRAESLAPMGVQGISGAAASMARAGTDSRRITPILKQIADISSGDPKAFQAMTQAVSQVQSSGKTQAGVKALTDLGPMFSEAAGKAGTMSADEFMKAMASGELTPEAFKGQMDRLGNTLMGTFKGMITKFYTSLADMGMIFLDPLRNALAQIEHILLRSLFRVQGTITSFGLETFIPKLIGGVERFSNWWVSLIVNDLPRLMEVYGKIADWWRDFTSGTSQYFGKLGESMDKFKESGDAAWNMWKNIFREIGEFFGGRFKEYDKDITSNLEQFQHFGTTFGRVVAGLLAVVTAFKDEFMGMLPELNDFFDFLTMEVFPVMQDFAVQFAKSFKSALPVIRNIASAFLPVLKALNSLIGSIGGSSGLGGLAVLVAGWLTMSKGGQASMGYMGAGYRGAGHAGGKGAWSYRLGQAASGRMNTARGAFGGGAGMIGSTRAFFGRGASGLGGGMPGGGMLKPHEMAMASALGVPVGPQGNMWQRGMGRMKGAGMKGMFGGKGMRPGGLSLSKGMGMGPMMAMMMGSQLLGSMIPGEGGEAVSSAGSYAAMGSMFGVGGAVAGAGLGMAQTANKARTGKGGALSGAAAGAAIGSFIPGIGTVGGAIIGGVLGWARGSSNAKKLAQAGRDLAEEIVDGVAEGFETKSRSQIEADVKDLSELVKDEVRMKDMAKQGGVSFEAFDAEMRLRQVAMEEEIYGTNGVITRISAGAQSLADITGESAQSIEDNAERWGIALQAGESSIDAYIQKLNESFSEISSEEIASLITGSVYDTLMNTPADIEEDQRRAKDESKAAINALFTDMETTGKVDMDLWTAVRQTGLGVGTSLGLEGNELMDFVAGGLQGLGQLAKDGGYTIPDELIASIATDPFKEKGGFAKTTIEDFKESDFYAQNLTQMGGLVGMDPETLDNAVQAMFLAGNAEQQLEILNQTLHSEAAAALADYVNETNSATEAVAHFRGILLDDGTFDADAFKTYQAAANDPEGAARLAAERKVATDQGQSADLLDIR
jgi:hypothetical protein